MSEGIKASELRKDTPKSVRLNSEILKLIEQSGLTVQSFLDQCLDDRFGPFDLQVQSKAVSDAK